MLNVVVSHSSASDSSRNILGHSRKGTVPASSRSEETEAGDRCGRHLPATAFKLKPPSPPRNHRVLSDESNLRTIESWGRSGSRWCSRPPAAHLGCRIVKENQSWT